MDNLGFIGDFLLALKFELIRYRMAATIIAVSILLLVITVGINWKESYTSSATLEIDDSNIIQPLLEGRAQLARVNRVDEARQTIQSRQLLESVASELGYIDTNSSAEEVAKIVNALLGGIVIETNQQPNFFRISYNSDDASMAFESIKVIVTQLVNIHRQARQTEGEEAYSFIASRAEVYKRRLEEAEDNLAEFKSQKLVLNENAVQTKINALQDDIQDLELQILENKTIVTTAKRQLASESAYVGAQSRLFELRQQKAPLERELADLRTQFKESYPDIVSITSQIEVLDRQIDEIIANSGVVPTVLVSGDLRSESNPELLFENLRTELSNAQRDLSVQQDRLRSLKKLLEEQQANMEVVASNEAELAELRRDYNVTREIYEETLNTRQNAELSVAITQEGLGLSYVVKEPPMYPLKPNGFMFWHFIVLAPILALGAPIAAIFALILLDPRVRILNALDTDGFSNPELIMVSPHCHSVFGDQILRKDVLLLAIFAGFAVVIYLALSFSGLQS